MAARKKKQSAGKPALTDAQRMFIVKRYACYDTTKEIMAALQEQWPNLNLSRQAVYRYNLDATVNTPRIEKWWPVFELTRKAFQQGLTDIPITNKNYRLARLQKELERSLERGSVNITLNILESAAKEVGDVHTNTRNVNATVHNLDSRLGTISDSENVETVIEGKAQQLLVEFSGREEHD